MFLSLSHKPFEETYLNHLCDIRIMKIVAVLYPGGEIARKTPELLGCAENALGLTNFLEAQGHEFVVLTDKEAGQTSWRI